MTVSNIAEWNPAILLIIRDALINAGAIDEGEEAGINSNLYVDALRKMNGIVKRWQADQIHVWTEEEAILFLQPAQARYLIGGVTLAHVADANAYLAGELSVNVAAAATAIIVDDGFLFTDGWQVGIELDGDGTYASGLLFWTTITSIVGNTLNLADALPGAATSGNAVFSYETNIRRPLAIPRARILRFLGMTETIMTPLSRQEYMDLPNKTTSAGIPTQFFYNPARDQGEIYIWPVTNTVSYAVRFTWYRPIFIFDEPTDTSDFPDEWISALTWALAKELAPSYGVDEPSWQRILAMATEAFETVRVWDREWQDVQFGIDTQGGNRMR